jgi:hypothetical protein
VAAKARKACRFDRGASISLSSRDLPGVAIRRIKLSIFDPRFA